MIQRPFSARHAEVLAEAMTLIAERGFAAASLRELASRLGIKEPSLYHYFANKDQLAEQIIDVYAAEAMSVILSMAPPPIDDLRGLIRTLLDRLLDVFDRPVLSTFVRFAFVIMAERPEMGQRIQGLLFDRGVAMARPYLADYISRGVLRREDAELAVRMSFDAVVMFLVKTRVFGAMKPAGLDPQKYADFVSAVVAQGVLHTHPGSDCGPTDDDRQAS